MNVLKSTVYAALRAPGNDGGGTTSDGSTGDGGEDDEDGMETKRRRKRAQSKKTQLVERGGVGLHLLDFPMYLYPHPPTTTSIYYN